MREDVIIFLGPSLSLKEAEEILPARYFPPAKQGDLLSVAVQFKPKIIGLIDGLFSQSLSVWHKEILFALSQGIIVLGASSMGALRAAETEGHGMIGIGKIFELYRSGEIIHDDEVALLHGPKEEGYIPLSLPLVNLRCTLDWAKAQGKMTSDACKSVLELIQAIDYPERSFERLAAVEGISKEILVILQENYIDQKKIDARLLLEKIKTMHEKGQPQPFSSTAIFEALYHYDRRLFFPTGDLTLRQIAHHAALHHPQFSDIQFHALNQGLAESLATMLKVEVDEDEIQLEKERFLLRHRLEDENAWILRNDFTAEEFKNFIAEKAMSRKLHRSLFGGRLVPWKHVKYFLNELKWNNQYEQWVEKARLQEQLFQEASPHFTEEDYPEFAEQELIEEHLRESQWNPDAPYRQWAIDAGFEGTSQLKIEILKAKIARDYSKEGIAKLASEAKFDDFAIPPK